MKNTKIILEDAQRNLREKEKLENINAKVIVKRYFSIIYELKGQNNGVQKSYILKISTTGRTCENEYIQYVYLNGKEINSLHPVLYSNKYNYLITKKENLKEFDKYLKSQKKISARINSFYRLGILFKELDKKTGRYSNFNKDEFDSYVLPRLNESTFFSKKEKQLIENKISEITTYLINKEIRVGFVSDFSLDNIHINNIGEFVLVDMGDAYEGNFYDNISYLYLNIRFGSLNQFFENKTNTKLYFSELIRGCETRDFDQIIFTLFQIKHLINLINFAGDQQLSSNTSLRKVLSNVLSRLKYKHYLIKLLSIQL